MALGHPLHSLVVHFPMAAFVLSWCLHAIELYWPGLLAVKASGLLLEIGLLAAIPALVTGLLELTVLKLDADQEALVIWHLSLMGSAVTVFFLGWLLAELGNLTPVGLFGVNTFGVALLLTGGWFGGELVYGDDSIVRES